ncbi:MAG: DsbA family protein [Edaphobacter sp.]
MKDIGERRITMQRQKHRLTLLTTIVFFLSPLVLSAQFLGTSPQSSFRNLALLQPPAGSKVAIVVFEDLGCPACAHAHPVEIEAARRANVPLLRYDFPIAGHVWTFQGAVYARYIQDKISPRLAEEFRSDVFAAQASIATKDDIERFTRLWLQRHNQSLPFVIDPDGSLAKAVKADYDLGIRINLTHTPTILVITKDQRQVVCGADSTSDPSKTLPTVEAALASTHSSSMKSPRSASPR